MRLVDAGDKLPEDVARLDKDLREAARKMAQSARDSSISLLTDQGLEPASQPIRDLIVPSPAQSYPLERWLVQAHSYHESEAVKVGIFSRLFAGEASRVKAGVIHDAKRFSLIETGDSRRVEIGVAVRLSVATSNVSAKLELTLPNLAAEAQLKNTDARVGITVIGYGGPLGSLLPAPRKLDVETCVEYLSAFQKIQAIVFGDEGWQHVLPTTLAYDE